MRGDQHAALTEHDVEVQFPTQVLIEPEREDVESDAFGLEVVRPDHGGIATYITTTDPALFEQATRLIPWFFAR
jgi:hypothetical protein